MFTRNEISCGRYGSANEVVRDALHTHLSEGATQAKNGEFVDDFSVDSLINYLDAEF